MNVISLAERGWVSDGMLRWGIRRLLANRLREEYCDSVEQQQQRYESLLSRLRQSPLAEAVDEANEQHYEVPTEFFRHTLGPKLKYSAALWDEGVTDLEQAEEAMLECYRQRARLEDGQEVLELGCGWGSLSLWMAAQFPNSLITAVSNSRTQKDYIDGQARELGLNNLEVITADINQFSAQRQYDRIVSVEMFEHVRNYEYLLERISSWVKPSGLMFIHIFCHRYLMYPFETEGQGNWMGRYFFTGGMMPAMDSLLNFQHRWQLDQRWAVSGVHYEKTAEAWLQRMDRNRTAVQSLFEQTYGTGAAKLWVQRWRMFFMACAELFGYSNGNQWLVAHYRFRPKS